MMSRIAQLRAEMAARDLPALLVTQRENIYYLSGFSGEDTVVILTEDRQLLVSDFRYQLQAEEEAPGWEFVLVERGLMARVRETLAEVAVPVVGFEPEHLSVAHFRELGGDAPEAPYRLQAASGIVSRLRVVKDPGEVALVREAVRITDAAYAHLLTLVKPGVTEEELALEAEWFMRRQGAQGASFNIIVAAGEHGALPHAVTGSRALRAGDMVVVDMGARYAHYCADLSRTFAVAEAAPPAQEIYRVCLRAQRTGLARIHGGMTGRAADAEVRAVIEEAGFGEYFGHGTGHGVGLEVHEAPRLNRHAGEAMPAGALVTVEPGIYLPGFGGVRIEDLVRLTDTGVEILTAAPKPDELPVVG